MFTFFMTDVNKHAHNSNIISSLRDSQYTVGKVVTNAVR